MKGRNNGPPGPGHPGPCRDRTGAAACSGPRTAMRRTAFARRRPDTSCPARTNCRCVLRRHRTPAGPWPRGPDDPARRDPSATRPSRSSRRYRPCRWTTAARRSTSGRHTRPSWEGRGCPTLPRRRTSHARSGSRKRIRAVRPPTDRGTGAYSSRRCPTGSCCKASSRRSWGPASRPTSSAGRYAWPVGLRPAWAS